MVISNVIHIQTYPSNGSKRKKNYYFSVDRNVGEGDCLFLALHSFLIKNCVRIKDNHCNNSLELRKFLVNQIASISKNKENCIWKEFRNEIIFNHQEQIPILSRLAETTYGENKLLEEESQIQYKNYMMTPNAYGTLIELYVAAKLFGFHANVLMNTDENKFSYYNFEVDNNKRSLQIYLLFTGPSTSGHFELLNPIQPKCPQEIPAGEYIKAQLPNGNTKYDIEYSLQNSSTNKLHQMLLNEEPLLFTCSVCGKRYKSESGRLIHIRKTHKEISNNIISNKYSNIVNNISGSDYLQTEQINVDSEDSLIVDNEAHSLNDKSKQHNIKLNVFVDKLKGLNGIDVSSLDNLCEELIEILKNANMENPGPKHPATKFHESRKNAKLHKNVQSNYQKSKNPQLTSKRARQRRNEKYNHQLMQHFYYNQRKRCVTRILKESEQGCKIPMKDLYAHFSERWSTSNSALRPDYKEVPKEEQEDMDNNFNKIISKEDILWAISKIKSDSAPGPDRIYPRTLKLYDCSEAISIIATMMLKTNYIPNCLRSARTILINKNKGSRDDPNNWRPITVSSVVRRCIEKALDKELSNYLSFNQHQKGFVHMPGCYINSSILAGCLNDAKKEKKSIIVLLLDLRQAFDNIGHKHIIKSFSEVLMPTLLRQLIISLQVNNSTRLEINGTKSEPINFKKGIFQGSSLSPKMFNTSINYVINDLSDENIASEYGYHINEELGDISVLSFVDDTVILSKSRKAATVLYKLAEENFKYSGLSINPAKSKAIIIDNGRLSEENLIIDDDISIEALKQNEMIKYLGVSFQDQLVLDEEKIITSFSDNMNKLISTPTLYPEQKISIINQYIWPQLIYPFQTCSTARLKLSFLSDIDKIIRNTLKSIMGMPDDMPTSMIYSSCKNKGLGILRASWEAFIQSYNICEVLRKCNDPMVNFFRDLEKEQEHCLKT